MEIAYVVLHVVFFDEIKGFLLRLECCGCHLNHVINNVIKNNIGTISSCFFLFLQTTSADIIKYNSRKWDEFFFKLWSSLVLKAFWNCYRSAL